MKVLELFSGAGGLALGLSSAGLQVAAAIEKDRVACSTYKVNLLDRMNHVHTQLFNQDILEFDYSHIGSHIDVISGGPPCQPFSLAGQRKCHADERNLFPYCIDAVTTLRPKAFLFENVVGISWRRNALYFEYLILSLTYPTLAVSLQGEWRSRLPKLQRHARHTNKIPEYHVKSRTLNSADYGVPQVRERIYIIGTRHDLNRDWHFPPPTHSQMALLKDKICGDYYERHDIRRPSNDAHSRTFRTLKRDLVIDGRKPWVTVRDALSDLPAPADASTPDTATSGHTLRPGAKAYPRHSGSELDFPSKTLKAGVHGTPGGENMVQLDDGTVRYFTTRELARLQGFPDWFDVIGTASQVTRQIGNAVPVPMGRILGDSIRRHLTLGHDTLTYKVRA